VARRVRLLIAAWLLLLAGFAALLLRPAPLLVNLGAGDEPFARGFRGSWERDGLQGSGETQFRWTLDGARLQLPLRLDAEAAVARLRLARFTGTAAEITLLAGERVVAQWRQPPRGWRVETVALGRLQGPLVLRFRSRSEEPAGSGDADLGVALDWVELGGVRRVWPEPRLLAGLLAFLFGLPALALIVWRRPPAALWSAALVAALAGAAVGLDRFGGLVALGTAGPVALLVLALLALVAFGLGRVWPEHLRPWPAALAPAAALVVVALVALDHPFFHYPDVDTHARFVRAIRQDGTLLLDPTGYQLRSGAWTREIAGRRIAFPYSPAFHVLATPLALLWDEVRAVKALGVLAAGLTVLLVHVLGRALGLSPRVARLAQALLALLPVTSSRLTLALFPALLGQALEALLLAHLMRRLDHLEGARDSAAAFGFLLLAQLAYTGSVINVAAVVVLLAAWEVARAEWRRAARLLGAWGLSLGLVGALLYARFLPVLWQQVLPHARESAAEAAVAGSGGGLFTLAAARADVFFDFVFPLLTALGLILLRAPVRPRRVALCALAAGLALLVLRFTTPALFRDAKEVELLALPVSVLSAAAVGALLRRGRPARVAVLLLLGLGIAWCASRAVALYTARFVAVGL
jgi:hypothetical protein